jgi:hypothetical protein
VITRAWKPGRGYRTAIRNTSWWRNNHDGTITAVVVMTMWPVDEPFTENTKPEYELWTVRLPLDLNDVTRTAPWWRPWRPYWMASGPIYMLGDKPHRIAWWDEDRPEREVLSKGPLPAKLVASIQAEERKKGYRP